MISGHRVVAVIPARGGSKSIPRKNLKPLAGRPLLVWSIDVARRVPEVDRIIVSTDDAAIAQVARDHEAEVYERPAKLATDDALVIDALRDLIRRLRAEGEPATIMILLEPTCPLRSAPDVSACLQTLVDGKDSVATFRQAELNPHRAWAITDGCPVPFISGAIPWLPRQKLPEAYQLNGAVYAFFTDRLPTDGRAILFGKAGAVMMPKERSIDIDDEADFERIEALLRRRANVQDPA